MFRPRHDPPESIRQRLDPYGRYMRMLVYYWLADPLQAHPRPDDMR